MLISTNRASFLIKFRSLLYSKTASQASMSHVQPTMGTIRWMAPELLSASSSSHISNPADVYAFGITCYEVALEGQLPWGQAHNAVIIEDVKSGIRPDRPPKCVDRLWEVMRKCVCHDPAERIGFETVVAALRTLVDDEKHAITSLNTSLVAISLNGTSQNNSLRFPTSANLTDTVPPAYQSFDPSSIALHNRPNRNSGQTVHHLHPHSDPNPTHSQGTPTYTPPKPFSHHGHTQPPPAPFLHEQAYTSYDKYNSNRRSMIGIPNPLLASPSSLPPVTTHHQAYGGYLSPTIPGGPAMLQQQQYGQQPQKQPAPPVAVGQSKLQFVPSKYFTQDMVQTYTKSSTN